LLESGVNKAKGDKMPSDWLDSLGNAEEDEYRRINSYPQGIEVEPEKYKEFVEERERILLNKITTKIV
jgi:hypothetical protein